MRAPPTGARINTDSSGAHFVFGLWASVTTPTVAAASVSASAIPTVATVAANVTAATAAEASVGVPSAPSEFPCERKPQKDAEDDRNLERSGEIDMHGAII